MFTRYLAANAYVAMDHRDIFPALSRRTYLNWASVGTPPVTAVSAVSEFMNRMSSMDFNPDFPTFVEKAETETRQNLARLISSDASELSFTGSSTTEGVQIFMQSLNPRKGSNLITTDLDFPLMFTELQKWRNNGVETRIWKNRSGGFNAEDLAKLVDDDTAAIAISSVNWVTGFRVDLAEVSRVAHEHGALLLVDSIQHVGSVEIDVKREGVDALSGGAHKWLLTPTGIGFLFVNKRAAHRLERANYGYENIVVPEGGWQSFWERRDKNLLADYRFEDDFRKFQYGGMKNHGGQIALNEALKVILSLDQQERDSIVSKLRETLTQSISELGFKLLSPFDDRHASGIFTFSSGSEETDRSLHRFLISRGIMVSLRGSAGIGGVRVSVNFLNDDSDVEKLIDAVRIWKSR